MIRVLILKTSILGCESASNSLIDKFQSELEARNSELAVTSRDLARQPIPPVNAERLAALQTDAATRDQRQQSLVGQADQLIAELQQADLVVIGAPMYNFSVPAGLKTWIDHVARAGVTFRYTENGPRGLLGSKQVVVISTMGGHHISGETDHLRPYLKTVLEFLGLDQVTFVAATGLNLGADSRQMALQQAEHQLAAVTGKVLARLAGENRSQEAA